MLIAAGRKLVSILVLALAMAAGLVWARTISDVQGSLISVDLQERGILVREKLLTGDGKDIALTLAPKAAIMIEKREAEMVSACGRCTAIVAPGRDETPIEERGKRGVHGSEPHQSFVLFP